jgi:4-alpha-glucanotransferase
MRFPRASGVLLHPTSLPGPHGSGDLGPSAYHFVDWLVTAGQRLWQILPLSVIGAGNSPYTSPSAYAGNVLLIHLADEPDPDPAFDTQRVNYDAVIPWRIERLRKAAAHFAAHGTAAERASFEAFCESHRGWLDDYTLFMALSQQHPGVDWCDWEPPLAQRDEQALQAARARHAEEIVFHAFCQWRFYDQWARLRAYANQRGVKVVGDAPIFLAFHSVEVWARPELFELDEKRRPHVVAGVPPDYFSATGQRWGNPLYRWSAHAAEHYAWWIERIRRTLELVDIVRIDHFRGFADYWEIDADEPTAIHGRWRPGPGAALFDAVARALGPSPIIAEDLGIVTPEVHALRRRFKFPGMRVLQFAFAEDSRNPYLPHHHEPDSVVYTGTHDNDTVLGWWASASEHERAHASAYLCTDGSEIHWDLIRAALASVADTAIVPMQDVLGLGGAHRMNRPGEASGHWAWRFQWPQVGPGHAARLAALSRLYGRGGGAGG